MRNLVNRLSRETGGNVVMIFALTALVIIAFVGVAIDVSRLEGAKRISQDALDSAVLAAAITNNSTQSTLKKMTEDNFVRNLGNSKLNPTVTAFTYDPKARTVVATADGTYEPIIMRIFGFKTLPYSVTAKSIKAADGTLEVALVLDNTWSMSATLDTGQQKIAVLKTAAQSLITAIMTPENKDYVRVAVVPYADYVNVGTNNRSWIDVGADYSTTSAKTCKIITTASQCTGGVKGTCTRVVDGVPETYSCWTTAQTCKTVDVTPYESCSGGGTTNYKWYGCVRNQMDSNKKLVMPDPSGKYSGILQTSQTCLNPILPLTNDSAEVKKSISGLVVNIGSYKPETYIPGGLVWGTNVLTKAEPFIQGGEFDPKNKEPRKTIVLMTDGSNTLYSNASGNIAAADASKYATQLGVTYSDQIRVCDYIKSKKIEIYTIGFAVNDTTALATLKACATDASHYFDAKSAADLTKAFETIGGKLSKVRLTG